MKAAPDVWGRFFFSQLENDMTKKTQAPQRKALPAAKTAPARTPLTASPAAASTDPRDGADAPTDLRDPTGMKANEVIDTTDGGKALAETLAEDAQKVTNAQLPVGTEAEAGRHRRVALKELEMVEATITKPFRITADDGGVHEYAVGTKKIPREHAEHWYAKAHGVTIND
jgi:hypothetical protein